jgi:hypothetical protein
MLPRLSAVRALIDLVPNRRQKPPHRFVPVLPDDVIVASCRIPKLLQFGFRGILAQQITQELLNDVLAAMVEAS